jgi:hypothetical protein
MHPDTPARVSNPADLLLRISRTPAGLQMTSPQLSGWTAIVRGPVPIAHAVDVAWRLLATVDDGGHNGLEKWDAACESLAASGAMLTAEDVIVVRSGRARRASGVTPMRGPGAAGQRYDPFDWVDLGNGYWQSPGPKAPRYHESSRQVQQVLAARARAGQQQPPARGEQLRMDEAG